MKAVAAFLVSLALSVGLLAQTTSSTTTTTTKKTTRKHTSAKSPAVTQGDLAAIRQMMQQQQQQLQDLKTELQQKDAVIQQTQQQLSNLQNATSDAQNKASAAQEASSQSAATISSLKSDVSDIKLNTTNAATSTQEDQKRMTALEGVLNRFRFGGDVRVRYDGIFQSYSGCPTGSCEDRNRARIRIRFGAEGKLNEDFVGGFYLATGALTNGAPSFTTPVSNNETLTGFFEKKAIGLDRGWITYNPQAHKWLELTGGKFAYNWQHTNYTFDPDLNPEGFSEKFSFNLANAGPLKNVTFQGIQLLYNEVSKGRDSYAEGGQFLTKWKPINAWTITPSFTLLDWDRIDPIANAVLPVPVCAGAALPGCLPQVSTTAVGTPVKIPVTTAIQTLTASPMTNSTVVLGSGAKQTRGFAARFTYADLIIDNNITTPWKRFPLRLLGEYENNLRDSVNNRNTMYVGQVEVGQVKDKHDFLIGYMFNRTDQDAVISQFVEDDQRSPTNVIQHKFYANYALAKNTNFVFTWFHGRVQDATLQNAPIFAAPFDPLTMKDPYQNRLQVDVVYKF